MNKLFSLFYKKHRKNVRPAAYDLDTRLERYLNFNNGFFIEAGANDGYSQSNTYFLEKKLHWHGILVEGIPELFKKCKKERPESIVLNYALVSKDFPHKTVSMHYAHLMSLVDGSLKTKKEQENHIKDAIDNQKLNGSYTVDVPARTLESILDNIKSIPRIDFFSLDVEGYELNVLKGLNFSKYRPKFILVETHSFDEVNIFLEEHNYELLEKMTIHDYFYKNKDYI